ncbi:MAG: nitroreductase family protein [Candidatus Thorarchaeota archaeon]|jgi:nitroreductase
MEFIEVIEKRRSIRRYKKSPIPKESIVKVLEAGRRAPSAFNNQPWHFIVVENEERKKSVADPQYWAANAPIIIVALGLELPEISDVHYPQYFDSITEYHKNRKYLVDVGIAFEHVILAATDLGLATCWMIYSWDRDAELKKILDIPEKYRVIARTPLGYPDEESKPKCMKSIDEIISWEKFGSRIANNP